MAPLVGDLTLPTWHQADVKRARRLRNESSLWPLMNAPP